VRCLRGHRQQEHKRAGLKVGSSTPRAKVHQRHQPHEPRLVSRAIDYHYHQQVINRSSKYKNRYIHRRDSLSLAALSLDDRDKVRAVVVVVVVVVVVFVVVGGVGCFVVLLDSPVCCRWC